MEFLRGILEQGGHGLSEYQEVIEFCEDLYNTGHRSPFLIAFLIDTYEEICLKEYENDDKCNNYAKKVFELCEIMSKKHDIIRRKYWDYVAEKLRIKLKSLNEIKNNCSTENADSSS